MSVLIKGMEMPKNCAECFFHKVFPATGVGINQLYCALCGINIVKLSDAQPDCPLVPVPPHGRCVDADKLMQEMRLFIKENMLSRDDARELLETIENAPTVIEAEEGE